MRKLLWVLISLAVIATADEASDRQMVESIVRALNSPRTISDSEQLGRLFTSNASTDAGEVVRLQQQMAQVSDSPLSEATSPQFVIQSIRFVTADVAIVDANDIQYGSTLPVRRIPVLFVMSKSGSQWQIAAFRLLMDSTNAR